MRDAVLSLVVETLRGVGEEREIKVPRDLDHDTPLLGQHGILDSLGLVILVVALEQAIEDRLGVTLSLADERALSQTRSPYRTIGTMVDYTCSLLRAEGRGA
jgi:acyl carrier protein